MTPSRTCPKPRLTASLGSAPPNLQRHPYDAYRLRVRYDRTRRAVTLQVTVTADALATLTATAHAIRHPTSSDGPPDDVALVLCAPGGI